MSDIEKKDNFMIKFINYMENFSFENFKKKKKEEAKKLQEEDIAKESLLDAETTIDHISKERKSFVKNIGKRILIWGMISIFITAAIIVSLQDNEQKDRAPINTKVLLKDNSSFGKIDEEDYFLNQNIANDRIDKYNTPRKTNNFF